MIGEKDVGEKMVIENQQRSTKVKVKFQHLDIINTEPSQYTVAWTCHKFLERDGPAYP